MNHIFTYPFLAKYHPCYILNFDETMIVKDPVIKRIVTDKGAKKVPIKTSGKEKQGYTIAPLVSLSGKLLTTLMVWPSKGKKAFQINTPSNLFIVFREEGSWIDSKVIEEYTRQVIRPYFRDQMPKDLRGLLLIDNHECHKVIGPMLKSQNVDILFFPPNCTSLLQPLDISTNYSIKSIYRDMWTDWHTEPEANKKMVVVSHKKQEEISNETFISWVSRTLKKVEKQTIINGWNPLLSSKNQSIVSLDTESMIPEYDESDLQDTDIFQDLEEEEHGFINEMLNYEVIMEEDILIKIENIKI